MSEEEAKKNRKDFEDKAKTRRKGSRKITARNIKYSIEYH